ELPCKNRKKFPFPILIIHFPYLQIIKKSQASACDCRVKGKRPILIFVACREPTANKPNFSIAKKVKKDKNKER
ncbi:TPA: hypothetical protein ACOQ5S_005933, partial [Bacillus cereus]